MLKLQFVLVIALAGGLAACGESSSLQVSDGTGPSPKLPEPNKTLIPTVNIAPAIGWPAGAKPIAAAGTQVAAFAENLDHPRWLYVLPNGDVLVAETNAPPKPDDSKGIRGWVMTKVMGRAGAGVPSPNRITLLRDKDHDGVAETRTVFLENLNSPFGMTLVGNDLYVADTDRLLRFHYETGDTTIKSQPIKVTDLPGGTINHHWTKNVIASKDGSKLYVTVGSNSNVGENGLDKEEGRAAIWEVDRATGNHRIFALGLRNPNGMGWEPTSGALWTAVNERDEIGSDLVPTTSPRSRTARSMAGHSVITGNTSMCASPHKIRTWWPKPSPRITPSARTPPHWGSPLPKAANCLHRLPTAPSSASTARGTANRIAATRLFSCRSRQASRPGSRWMC